jgi:hypothetical protein
MGHNLRGQDVAPVELGLDRRLYRLGHCDAVHGITTNQQLTGNLKSRVTAMVTRHDVDNY